jgi:hypothetical protein
MALVSWRDRVGAAGTSAGNVAPALHALRLLSESCAPQRMASVYADVRRHATSLASAQRQGSCSAVGGDSDSGSGSGSLDGARSPACYALRSLIACNELAVQCITLVAPDRLELLCGAAALHVMYCAGQLDPLDPGTAQQAEAWAHDVARACELALRDAEAAAGL